MTLVVDASIGCGSARGQHRGRALGQSCCWQAMRWRLRRSMPVEAVDILRRSRWRAAGISADVASLAHADLLDLRVEFFPISPARGVLSY